MPASSMVFWVNDTVPIVTRASKTIVRSARGEPGAPASVTIVTLRNRRSSSSLSRSVSCRGS